MIKRIKLKNFQSHDDSELIFDSGINVIIGSSNSGKSSILRGLNWVKNNRPVGVDSIASYWVKGNKNKLNDELLVEIETEQDVVQRKRVNADNMYVVNGLELNCVKTDVPEEVIKILNFADSAVQNQQDMPFLISNSSGEVAKYFNKVVNLEVIDKVLSKCEKEKKQCKHEIEEINARLTKLETLFNDYWWVEDVKPIIMLYDSLVVKQHQLCSEKETLNEKIKILKSLMTVNVEQSKLKELSEMCDIYENEDNNLNKVKSEKSSLLKKIEIIKKLEKEVDFHSKEVRNYLSQYEELLTNKKELTKNITVIEKLVENIKRGLNKIEKLKVSIEQQKKQLPEVCPLCGSKNIN